MGNIDNTVDNAENVFYQNRKIGKCVADGMKLFARYFGELFRIMWMPLVLTALCASVASSAVAPLARMLHDMTQLDFLTWGECWTTAVVIMGLLVLLLPGTMCLSQLVRALSLYADYGHIPLLGNKMVRSGLHSGYGRALGWNAGWMILALLVTLPALWLLGLKWTLVVVFPVAILLLFVPYCVISVSGLVKMDFRMSILQTIKSTFCHWGHCYAVVCGVGLLTLLLVVISCMPAIVLSFSEMNYGLSLLNGDAVSVPACFPYVRFVSVFLAFVLSSMAVWTAFFSCVFLYVSLCVREKDGLLQEMKEQEVD
ncbi:MAG: hypothetical protein NC388_03370 [Clostridium sp.]|nr:hypothetical protein [Clostridium sp.]